MGEQAATDAKAKRLAAALRENLKRRKVQLRGRSAMAAEADADQPAERPHRKGLLSTPEEPGA